MKLKLLTALLGLTLAISLTAFAQVYTNDQQTDSKPSAGVPMQGPNNTASEQDSYGDSSSGQSSSAQSSSAQGQDSDQTYNTSAPAETNGVARISLIRGDVSTQGSNGGDWSAATLNAPVVAGDRISTGDKARVELQLDYANMLRLAEHTQANITQLTRSQIQIQLGRGMANYSVFRNSDADAEIDTPNVGIRTGRRESSFRILVNSDDHTEVLVRSGEVEVTTPQGGTRVTAGQFITIQGTGDDEQYRIAEAPVRDDWDQWNSDRDNTIRNAASRKRTNDYYVGAEDLDNNGTWSEIPDYGPVWHPDVDDDWAPYRDGRWVYEPYWGWTWVSYDSWGWAPYHYGRWMYSNASWYWWPGPVYASPYYYPIWAPAYVSFSGWGGGFGFGFGWGGGWGSVGWIPLGPCDHFHPWWGQWGRGYVASDFHSWNRGGFAPLHGGTAFSNVRLAINDPHFRGGTTVSGNQFGRARMVSRPMQHVDLQNARFTTGRLPVTPGRESFSASGRPAAPSTIRNVRQNQTFFSNRVAATSPRAMERTSQQIASLNRQNNGSLNRQSSAPGTGHDVPRPGGNSNVRPSNGPNGFNGSRSGSTGGSNVSSNNGFHPFGQTGSTPPSSGSRSGAVSSPSRGPSNTGSGWQKFTPMPPRSSAGPSRPSESSGRAPASRPVDRGSFGYPRSSSEPQNRSYSPGPQTRGYNPGPENRSYNPGPQTRGYSPGPQNRSYSPGGFGGNSRPPLNMRQPIVTPRSSGGPYSGSSAPSYGGRSSSPYGGGHSAPSYGGGRSAPSYGGGGHSAPSGGSPHGSGSSHGGGGGGGGRHGR